MKAKALFLISLFLLLPAAAVLAEEGSGDKAKVKEELKTQDRTQVQEQDRVKEKEEAKVQEQDRLKLQEQEKAKEGAPALNGEKKEQAKTGAGDTVKARNKSGEPAEKDPLLKGDASKQQERTMKGADKGRGEKIRENTRNSGEEKKMKSKVRSGAGRKSGKSHRSGSKRSGK